MSSWNAVRNLPNFSPHGLALLTDGSVLCFGAFDKKTYRLTPDKNGRYESGSWSGPFNMANTRQYFASGLLKDGRWWVVGGEYSDAGGDTPLGEIFNPTTNTWSKMNKDPNFNWIQGDCISCTMADGRVIFGALNDSRTAIWDPDTNIWTEAGTGFGTTSTIKATRTNEETWTLMPDGTVVTVQCFGDATQAQKYVPSEDIWVSANSLTVKLAAQTVSDPKNPNNPQDMTSPFEIGPAMVLPDGRLLAIGATGFTGIYTAPSDPTQAGFWTTGTNLPTSSSTFTINGVSDNLQTALDAPCCILPNGKVVIVAGPLTNFPDSKGNAAYWSAPSNFFLYDYTNGNITALDKPAPNNRNATFTANLLVLPTGQMMYASMQNVLNIYTPDPKTSEPQDAWRPSISNIATPVPNVLAVGHTYSITGAQLTGLSSGSSYGDDVQNATNYPLVKVTSTEPALVRYLKTSEFSYRGISKAGDTSAMTATLEVPTDLPAGNYNLTVVANGIESHPLFVRVISQDCFIVTDRSSYSQGEVQAILNAQGAPATFNPSVYVVVEGFTPGDLQLNANNLGSPPTKPSFGNPAPGISFQFVGPVIPEDPKLPNTPQRFTFEFQISFQDVSPFKFPGLGPLTLPISTSLFTPKNQVVQADAVIYLLKTPDPYILHGDAVRGNPWYLSVDIRVFQIPRGKTRFGVTVGSGNAPDAATAYIQQVLKNLNADPAAATAAFESIPLSEDASSLAIASQDASGTPIYNFALARVRSRDVSAAENVRCFFRMWPGAQSIAKYDPNTLYRSGTVPQPNNQPTKKIPLLGLVGDEITTIPFFAEKRVNTSAVSMLQQSDAPNIQTIKAVTALGGEVDTYFGVWLDINQPGRKFFPSRILSSNKDGPYKNQGPLFSVQELVRSQHQCLVAEIAYDPDAIMLNSDPGNSDKLAQRNIAFVGVPNPGLNESRTAPQIMELRPTPPLLARVQKYDELMIVIGGVPAGTVGNIYLPATTAQTILKLADQIYWAHELTKVDDNTISFHAGGVSYIPVPPGTDAKNFVALMTLDLPLGIKKGQLFTATVKQMSRAFATLPFEQIIRLAGQSTNPKSLDIGDETGSRRGDPIEWRSIIGVFKVQIPVSTKAALLLPEKRLLSVLRYISLAIDPSSRWFLPFQRYLSVVTGRVTDMGGDPTVILPDPNGNSIGGRNQACDGKEVCGKVVSLEFDRCGRFDGFCFLARDGKDYRFEECGNEIKELVERCWQRDWEISIFLHPRYEHVILKFSVHGKDKDEVKNPKCPKDSKNPRTPIECHDDNDDKHTPSSSDDGASPKKSGQPSGSGDSGIPDTQHGAGGSGGQARSLVGRDGTQGGTGMPSPAFGALQLRPQGHGRIVSEEFGSGSVGGSGSTESWDDDSISKEGDLLRAAAGGFS